MILVQAAPGGARGRAGAAWPCRAINPGFDASYPWREIGTAAAGAALPGPLEYYLAPAEKGGEPPGVWAGRGLAALGLEAGQVIEREVFEKLFGQDHWTPGPHRRHRLGRKAQQFETEEDIFAGLAAAEPHASPGAAGRAAVAGPRADAAGGAVLGYHDLGVQVGISLLYGSRLAMAEEARQRGDRAGRGGTPADAARVWAIVARHARPAWRSWRSRPGTCAPATTAGRAPSPRAELGQWQHARDWVRARSPSTPPGRGTRSCTSTTWC